MKLNVAGKCGKKQLDKEQIKYIRTCTRCGLMWSFDNTLLVEMATNTSVGQVASGQLAASIDSSA